MAEPRPDDTPEVNPKDLVPLDEIPMTRQTLTYLSQQPTTPERYQGKPDDMFAAFLIGRELGIGPMSAISNLYLVGGDASMKGKLMCALIFRAGHLIKLKVNKKTQIVTATAIRWHSQSKELVEVGDWSFGPDDAALAELNEKPAYLSYPLTMYAWKAIAAVGRFYFADVLEGISYLPHELDHDDEVEPIPESIEVSFDGEDDVLEAEVVDDATAAVVEGLDAEAVS